ncbi:DUF4232 domain-containing protein [Streptomyces sp. NBC_00669]|uniref:DUF4232 domain-containing protein n=1 Tax=Streptomyces sp. NBC_00669 TaxID=2976011 RepID=UPI002E33A93F|nr:DUF4232 domain-containing protein [Streptomyces sp. NBC_00669]
MNVKSVLTSSAVLLVSALGLTACQSGSTSASDATPSQQASAASVASGGKESASAPAASPSGRSTSGGSSSGGSGGSKGSTGSGNSGGTGGSGGSTSGSHATSDSYAFAHPCTAGQVRVTVTRRDSAPTQRVIEVRNTGASSCGLSYFPLVSLDDSHAADGGKAVKPLIPSGLGGAPAFPVYAGHTAYAVLDLDPSGATSGTVDGIDELNVLANGDHMPNADTVNFRLGSGSLVLKPKLGLYGATVAEAVASMRTADTSS